MTNPAPSGGGMPKWLIILLVVLLVVIVGCCGGIGTCVYLVRRAAQKMPSALQHMQQQMLEDAQKQRDAAMQQQPNAAATPIEPIPAPANATPETPAVPTTPPTPSTPPIPAAPAPEATPAPSPAAPLAVSKFPRNFPTDIPILNGLAPIGSTSDNTAGTGMVILNGKVKTDDVVTYYTQALEKQGYTQTTNTSINDMTTLVYTKDNLQVSVVITPGDNNDASSSKVMIGYGKK